MQTPRDILDLPTPVLLLDWPVARRNIEIAAEFVSDKVAKLRPHFKNHKCTELAKRQLAGGGCAGITASNLVEAAALVNAGIDDVLIANQVAGPANVARLVELAGRAQVRAAVDGLANAKPISDVAVAAGVKVGVLLEVDTGMTRCGVQPGPEAVAVAEQVGELPGLRFDGIQAYEGHAIGIDDDDERGAAARKATQLAVDTRRLMEAKGIPVNILSGAGTATYHVAAEMPGVDELQIGTYVTMDWMYMNRVVHDFNIALSIATNVISVQDDRFVLNIGVKGIGHEFGPPMVKDHPEFDIPSLGSEEHTIVQALGHNVCVGDMLELLPSHSCTTCSRHSQLVVHEDGKVCDVWPIDAAGYPLY